MSPEYMRDVSRQAGLPDQDLNGDNFDTLIEFPLRVPIRYLWEKGIRTSWSTANSTDTRAIIGIGQENLSPENLELARGLFHYRDAHDVVIITMSIDNSMPVAVVEQFFTDLVSRFNDQKNTPWDKTQRQNEFSHLGSGLD